MALLAESKGIPPQHNILRQIRDFCETVAKRHTNGLAAWGVLVRICSRDGGILWVEGTWDGWCREPSGAGQAGVD